MNSRFMTLLDRRMQSALRSDINSVLNVHVFTKHKKVNVFPIHPKSEKLWGFCFSDEKKIEEILCKNYLRILESTESSFLDVWTSLNFANACELLHFYRSLLKTLLLYRGALVSLKNPEKFHLRKDFEDKRWIYPLRWDLVSVGLGGGVRRFVEPEVDPRPPRPLTRPPRTRTNIFNNWAKYI